jgi:hypothetical protein
MCKLLGKYDKRSFTGYKIVAVVTRKSGRKEYYSPFMGNRYVQGKRVEPVEKQNRMIAINDEILTSSLFAGTMSGRTSVFTELKDAQDEFKFLKTRNKCIKRRFVLSLVKAKVSDDMLFGEYFVGATYPIVAGRRIRILEVVK